MKGLTMNVNCLLPNLDCLSIVVQCAWQQRKTLQTCNLNVVHVVRSSMCLQLVLILKCSMLVVKEEHYKCQRTWLGFKASFQCISSNVSWHFFKLQVFQHFSNLSFFFCYDSLCTCVQVHCVLIVKSKVCCLNLHGKILNLTLDFIFLWMCKCEFWNVCALCSVHILWIWVWSFFRLYCN